MTLDIQQDAEDRVYVEVEEVVAPDIDRTFPLGQIVPLSNEKAYYFGQKNYGGAGKAVRQAHTRYTAAALGFKSLFPELPKDAEGEEMVTPDIQIDPQRFETLSNILDDAVAELIRASLAINYSDETITQLLDTTYIDEETVADIVKAVKNQPLDYEVRVKKKSGELPDVASGV